MVAQEKWKPKNKIQISLKPKAVIVKSCCNKKRPCMLLSGSLTLEASMIVPLFFFFLVFLLCFFKVMEIQLKVQESITYGSMKTAACIYEQEEDKDSTYLAAAKALAQGKLYALSYPKNFIAGQQLGVFLAESNAQGDYVQLQADYIIRLPVPMFGMKNLSLEQHSKVRKWIGEKGDKEGDEQDPYVYVAENGEVYHTHRDCTHLTLSIQKVSRRRMEQSRNLGGGRYSVCELCGDGTGRGNVYITEEGNRYHTSVSCSGLKRTVYMVRLSQVGGKPLCSKCGRGK